MKTKFSLLFYIRKPKNYESGPMPVWVRITVKGKRSETPSGRECEPAQWNSAAAALKALKKRLRLSTPIWTTCKVKFTKRIAS